MCLLIGFSYQKTCNWSIFLMTLSIRNGGYTYLIRLDLILSISLWKEFQLLQILNDLCIKHLIKLILYENDEKLLKTYHTSNISQINLYRPSLKFSEFYIISILRILGPICSNLLKFRKKIYHRCLVGS